VFDDTNERQDTDSPMSVRKPALIYFFKNLVKTQNATKKCTATVKRLAFVLPSLLAVTDTK
jgi:hypothetical protein